MSTYTCNRNFALKQYILMFDDELMSRFVENKSLECCGLRTNCRIYLTNRWLNRAIKPGCWNRYFIVNVSGEDNFAIDQCNRLIERLIPEFRLRQVYKSKSKITLYTNEWVPDNSPVNQSKMRIGPQRSNFGTLHINSPYSAGRGRKHHNTPWKITHNERLGHYESGDIYRPILVKSELGPVDFVRSNFPLVSDVRKFNFLNHFDRYSTFKAIDNEHCDKTLQEKACKYMASLKNSSDKPKISFDSDARTSVVYKFEPGVAKSGSHTLKIERSDSRSPSLHKLSLNDIIIPSSKALQSSNVNSNLNTDHIDLKVIEEISEETTPKDSNTDIKTFSKSDRVDLYASSFEKLAEEDDNNFDSKIDTKIEESLINLNVIPLEDNVNNNVPNGNVNNEILGRLSVRSCSRRSNIKYLKNPKRNSKPHKVKHGYPYQKFVLVHSCLHGKRRGYYYKSRAKRMRYYRLMKEHLRKSISEPSTSKLTDITSPILTETITLSRASKSSNIDDNTLDSLRSF